MKPARTKDQRIAQQVAFDHGHENGRADALLGRYSDLSRAQLSDPETAYTRAYAEGYAAGHKS